MGQRGVLSRRALLREEYHSKSGVALFTVRWSGFGFARAVHKSSTHGQGG